MLGSATFLWGLVLLFFLPDSIATARFLSPEEKQCAEQRVILRGTGKTKHTWKSAQMLECFMDPKTFFFLAISLLTQIPNGGTQNFGNLVLKGFGFTSLETTLVTLPASVISILCIVSTGRAAGHWSNITLFLICAVVLCPVAGSAIIYSSGPYQGVKLFAYYLLSTGPSALPLSLSLISVNYKGSTKKMTMTAVLFLAYCAGKHLVTCIDLDVVDQMLGNIAGPQFFKSSEEPQYPTAFKVRLSGPFHSLADQLSHGL